MKSSVMAGLAVAALLALVPATALAAPPHQIEQGSDTHTYNVNGETATLTLSLSSNDPAETVNKKDTVRVTLDIEYTSVTGECSANQPRSCSELSVGGAQRTNPNKGIRLFQRDAGGDLLAYRIPGSTLDPRAGDFPALKQLSGSRTFTVQKLGELGFDTSRPITVDVPEIAFVDRDDASLVTATPDPASNQGILRFSFDLGL